MHQLSSTSLRFRIAREAGIGPLSQLKPTLFSDLSAPREREKERERESVCVCVCVYVCACARARVRIEYLHYNPMTQGGMGTSGSHPFRIIPHHSRVCI